LDFHRSAKLDVVRVDANTCIFIVPFKGHAASDYRISAKPYQPWFHKYTKSACRKAFYAILNTRHAIQTSHTGPISPVSKLLYVPRTLKSRGVIRRNIILLMEVLVRILL